MPHDATALGYGSTEFERIRAVAAACHAVEGRGMRGAVERLRAGSRDLARYERRLPRLPVTLSGDPSGRMIAEHLAIRDGGRLRYRDAQGILRLPDDVATYLRGRPRQALRTNLTAARRGGLYVSTLYIDDWEPGDGDTRAPFMSAGPVERWIVWSADHIGVAEAILTVDREVALLHGLITWEDVPTARWLLHTAIVERLCGRCSMMMTATDAVYLMSEGNRYFQQRLGYEIVRLEFDADGGALDAVPVGALERPKLAPQTGT